MDQKLIDFNKSLRKKQLPEIQPGDVVRVHKKIKEGEKERIQVFKGLVIAIKGNQSSSPMITVRRESQGVGVEMTVPVYLPTIEKIEVLRHSKVRRSKLYYMRERSGKAAKMKVRDLSEKEIAEHEEILQKNEQPEEVKDETTEKKPSTEETKKSSSKEEIKK